MVLFPNIYDSAHNNTYYENLVKVSEKLADNFQIIADNFQIIASFFPDVSWGGYFRYKRYVKSPNIGKMIASYKWHPICIITRILLGKSKENSDVKCKYGFRVHYFSYYSLLKTGLV